uniref:Secreted protein n=1 Tax=Cyanistes caeruleus TaxID=156563 RepID=A0A8C0UCI6_CYACU
ITPIYILNCIILLQALIEIISNQSSLAIDLISAQSRQMRTMIYQNWVCGKFSSSERCVEIDNHSEIIRNITANVWKLAHVPIQKGGTK